MTAVAKRNVIRTFASIVGVLVALTLLFKWLGGPLARAAPSESGTGDDPCVEAITVGATLPVSDSRPGEGVARTVYFDTPGVLTLTFEISSSPPLTLSSDLAFGEPAQTITSGSSSWSPVIAYSVAVTEGNWPGIVYTVTNASGVQITVPLTYVRDTTPPVAGLHCPPAGDWISRPITLSGTTNDGTGSGVREVEVREGAAGEWTPAQGESPWTYGWTPPPDVERPNRPPRNASRMTKSMASMTMAVLILERPTCRSAKRMGNSATRPPSRST